MNKVILIGRLTKDPDVRHTKTQSGEDFSIARYTLAVDRRFVRKDSNEQSADFISCVAFAKSADFAEKYLRQGTKIAVSGRIQTGSYTNKEGQKVYTTDVVVEDHEFVESKKDSGEGQGGYGNTSAPSDGFFSNTDIEESLPFGSK